ncbi:uncharacterized protein LOC144566637 [Carex rostrata]
MFPRRPEFDQYGDAMSAYRWRHGGYYLPSPPPTPPDPRFHGYANYHTNNNPSYLHATPPSQHHMNLYASQPPNDRFYPLQNSLYRTSQYNNWTGPVQPLIPSPVRHVHPAILQTRHESFTQFPNYLSTQSVGQNSRTKPSKLNPTVQVRKNPGSTAKKVVVSESKQAPNNTTCSPATPIAVTLSAKESILWPKPDNDLVVMDILNPVNETQEHVLVPFLRKSKWKRKRKNKRNRKEEARKELPPEIQQNPSSTANEVEVSESKQAPNNTACTPATPIAVTLPANESIQWPKPDIELVVKDILNPVNETQEHVLGPFSRKRKWKRKRKNKKKRKEEVRKDLPTEQTVEIQQNPSSTTYNVEVLESKQVPNNTVRTPATPIVVILPTKESIQWPKPDIELVVKDIANPVNDFSRKRKNKKNRKDKVKKEQPPELMHYYRKHMVRDPWFNIKPVVGIIVTKCSVFSVIETEEKCEGGVMVDYSKMSLADCLEMTFEETVNGYSTVTEDQMYFL